MNKKLFKTLQEIDKKKITLYFPEKYKAIQVINFTVKGGSSPSPSLHKIFSR